jgi:alpha-glucosidase
MDELTVQIYPHGASRFELYEDDGRSHAYRRGVCALTPIVCVAERGRITVRVEAPTGDPSVVPANRRYLFRLRLERPARVAVEGAGDLQDTTADGGRPGWWMDDDGFLGIRTPGARTITIVVTPGSS